jgi:hypothetical protein
MDAPTFAKRSVHEGLQNQIATVHSDCYCSLRRGDQIVDCIGRGVRRQPRDNGQNSRRFCDGIIHLRDSDCEFVPRVASRPIVPSFAISLAGTLHRMPTNLHAKGFNPAAAPSFARKNAALPAR